jgi:hypothetical protein
VGFDAWLDILLLDSGFIEENVISAELLYLDNSVNHFGSHSLGAHDIVHLHLSSQLEVLEQLHRRQALLNRKFLQLSCALGVSELLHLVFVDGSLGWVHQISVKRLFKDLLWHFKGLVQVSLDKGTSKLLPVGALQNKLLVEFFVFLFDCSTAFGQMFFEACLCLLSLEKDNNFHSVKEVVESHGAIRLELGLTESFALPNDFFDYLFG